MNIIFEDEQQVSEEILKTMERACEYAIDLEIKDGHEALDKERVEISVSFVGKDEIHELNNTYRGVDKTTDVLSFPQFCDLDEEIPDVGPIAIGDVVICREKAEEQAAEFGHGFEREIIYLFTHSVLHLLGYDHEEEEDKKVMRAREEEIMDLLGIPRRSDS